MLRLWETENLLTIWCRNLRCLSSRNGLLKSNKTLVGRKIKRDAKRVFEKTTVWEEGRKTAEFVGKPAVTEYMKVSQVA